MLEVISSWRESTFFKNYALVVQWTTVSMMSILEILLKLRLNQGDVTAAFLHAGLNQDKKVYVEMPLGFRKKGKCLKFKKTSLWTSTTP